MSVLSRVRRTIREHRLAFPGTRVAVALSGGADSVALAYIAAELGRGGDFAFAGLAHFNHGLRETAARDEQYCRDVAASLGVPIETGRENVTALAHAGGLSIEDAAHRARHAFLDQARLRLAADVVAVGHTRDDQAETFLLRLVRGAGARGLSGMHPRNGCVIRPLLDCRRSELVAWLHARAISYVVDETNVDVAIPRNRVRAELIPLLEQRFNSAIVDVLADTAELARGEWLWLEESADAAIADLGTCTDGRTELDVPRLGSMPVALQRVVIWRAMSRLTSRPVTFAHVGGVMALLRPAADGLRVDAPGQTVQRDRNRLVLKSRGGSELERSAPHGAKTNLFEYSLSIPGEILIPELAGALTAEELVPGEHDPRASDRHVAIVRRDLCSRVLTVRNRRPGDRIRPIGLGGSRKLQDVFVDKKIARAERDRIPVVADKNGRILWVAGIGISDEFRVTDPAQPMLILRFKAVGGPA